MLALLRLRTPAPSCPSILTAPLSTRYNGSLNSSHTCRGIIDEAPKPGRWILTGSQNLYLAESVSQSLAGRTAVHHLLPLARNEVVRFVQHPRTLEEAVLAGGYPRIFDQALNPSEWLRSYVATYIERDVRAISQVGDLTIFQRFVELCAGRTAQLINYSALASDCGVSQPTARAWLGILEASFIVFRLPPFHKNLGKRLVKMPKLHFYDTGLVCWLIGIRTPEQLRSHPLRGPIFETWVISEIVKHRMNLGETRGLFFYRNRDGAEVDLVIEHPSRCHPGRGQVIPDPFIKPFRRCTPRSPPSGRFFPPM